MVDGPNMYGYAGNDPVNSVDSYGLFWETIFNDPIKRGGNKKNAISYQDFCRYAFGSNLKVLQHEADNGNIRSDYSAWGPAPKFRYVINPANPNEVLDMRHFLVVGPQGEGVGLLVETLQLISDRNSASDSQDFLSNAMGNDFYRNYYNKYKDMFPINQILEKYFKNLENNCKK
jgi:hypothetical protein